MKFSEQKGKFVKHCPCTPEAVSCGYYNLNLHTGCPYSCSYCILQAYLETKEPVFFTNLQDAEKELLDVSRTQKYLRIGTGELTDSLALDPQTNYSRKIIKIFEKFPSVIFEFKTKSANIGNLLKLKKVLRNIVISWSLNPQEIINREEAFTPSLAARLKAMEQVQKNGYKIGIHFDPLIYCQNWKPYYRNLVREIARVINPGRIAWWSLGALRFPYSLREHIFKHKDSMLFEGELIKGYDDKYRYFKPLRMELFRFVKQRIYSDVSRDLPLYLCMEDKEAWQELLPGIEPGEESVNRYLYQSATA
ncbi:MAG: hypothetical protein KAT34_12870 [Candidatus Aminicenantes bacterium]|nr:hypothetical protein [Candidatus Aminicenantes bacterium]